MALSAYTCASRPSSVLLWEAMDSLAQSPRREGDAVTTSALSQGSADWPYHEDVRWLRASALHRLLATAIAFGLLWFFVQASWLQVISLKAWSGTVALVGLSLLALLIERQLGFLPAACTSVAAAAAGVSLAAWAYSHPSVLTLLALPVGMASLLIGSNAGFAAAAAIGLGLAVGVVTPAAPRIPPPEASIAAMSAALTALLLWVATSPLRMTLQWSWASYERAQRQTEQLRENKGKLASTLKDLDAAYHRLELMAAELERARRAAVETRRLRAPNITPPRCPSYG